MINHPESVNQPPERVARDVPTRAAAIAPSADAATMDRAATQVIGGQAS